MMVWKRLGYLLPWRRRAAERDMQEELRSIAAMADPRELGNLVIAAEDARAQWGWTRLEQTGQDLHYALRTLSKSPGFTLAAVLSLAIGIGANTALFTVINTVMWKRLPVSDPEHLLTIGQQSQTVTTSGFTYQQYELFRDHGQALDLAAYSLARLDARIDGHVVGVIANNPLHKGGAIDVDACEKSTSFMVLCDSFNIPLVFMVDQPGFLIGIEGERRGAIGRVMNWMNAISLVTVPKFSIIVRKTYGQAVLNMGGGGNADVVLMWPSAEINFMDPRHAVTIVHGVKREEEPERFDELFAEMAKDTSAYEMASPYNGHLVIMPEQTRATLRELLESTGLRLTDGIGEHLMRTWPTSY